MSNVVPLGQRLVWGALFLVILALPAAAVLQRWLAPPVAPLAAETPVPPRLGQVGEFAFTNQHGQPVALKDLRGAPWIASFIFTRCYGQCPQITAAMCEVNQALADAPAIKLVSFTMDPDFDTPEVLAQYAQRSHAVSPRWLFLTGKKDDMFRLTRDSFKLGISEEGGTPAEPIIHSESLVLVDGEGRIRGYFNALDPQRVQALPAAARRVMDGD
jgi:cytochrome oxidase Cu insertion factor (SCO1/SenC/PrrC family)